MPNCSTCGIELQLSTCPACEGRPRTATGGASIVYIVLMIPGVFFSLHEQAAYPPLNARVPMGFLLSIFLLPVAIHMSSFLRKQPSEHEGRWRSLYICSSLALMLLALLLFLNGRLDTSLVNQVRVTVVKKVVLSSGKGATQYNLTVSSWRPGRSIENFNVVRIVFDRAVVGKTVTVDLHDGFLHLPWMGKISPE